MVVVSATTTGGSVAANTPANKILTITDNEMAGVTVSSTALTITEGMAGTYTLVLTAQPSADVILTANSSATASATVAPTMLTFTSSNWQVPQTATVTTANNNALGNGATTTINHTISGGEYGSVTVEDVALTITDNEMASALTKISAYAQTDGSPAPTRMDYTNAGVTGITIGNLATMNTTVAAISAERIKQLNTAIMPKLTQAMLGTTLTSISSRLDSAFSGAAQSSRGQLDGVSLGAQSIVLASFLQKLPGYVDSLQEGNTNWRRMLANSSFALSPQDAQSGSAKGLTVWGISDYYGSMEGKDDRLNWDGEVFTVQLGIDKRLNHNLLVGGLVSWSDGDVDADLVGIEQVNYQHQMISVHPYLAWSGKHAQLWGSLGYGQGKLKIDLGNNKPNLDTRLVSMVAGGEGHLSNRLSLKSDIALAQTDIDGSSLSAQQDTNSQRLRLLLKADLISCGHCTTALEAGARYDNGDGDSGLGAVLNASMAYNNPTKGLIMKAQLHTLLGKDDYSEWGLSALLELTTKANGRGLAFSLSPSYSLATQDSQAIWQENQLDSANNLYAADQQMQLETRLSYGLLAFATQGLLTPYSEVTFGDTNSYRLGIHWQGNNRLDLHLFGEHRESHSQRADQAIMLKGKFHF